MFIEKIYNQINLFTAGLAAGLDFWLLESRFSFLFFCLPKSKGYFNSQKYELAQHNFQNVYELFKRKIVNI